MLDMFSIKLAVIFKSFLSDNRAGEYFLVMRDQKKKKRKIKKINQKYKMLCKSFVNVSHPKLNFKDDPIPARLEVKVTAGIVSERCMLLLECRES